MSSEQKPPPGINRGQLREDWRPEVLYERMVNPYARPRLANFPESVSPFQAVFEDVKAYLKAKGANL